MTSDITPSTPYSTPERVYAKTLAQIFGVKGALRFMEKQRAQTPEFRVPDATTLRKWMNDPDIEASAAAVEMYVKNLRHSVIRSSLRIMRKTERAIFKAIDDNDALAASRYASAHAAAADRLLERVGAAPAGGSGGPQLPGGLAVTPGSRVQFTYQVDYPQDSRRVPIEAPQDEPAE